MAFQVILDCLIELLRSEFFAGQPTFVSQTLSMGSTVLLKQETTLSKLLLHASQSNRVKRKTTHHPSSVKLSMH